MFKFISTIDNLTRKFMAAFCILMMFCMVFFTDYTVVMRYVFDNPPVWGDTLTVLSNIWLVFFALVLTVREKEHIALNVIYSRLPTKYGFIIQQFWTLIILTLGIVICVAGVEVVARNGRQVLGDVVLHMGRRMVCLQAELHAQKYAMAILPIMGALVSISAFAAMVEDTIRLRNGQFKVAGGTGSSEEE